MNAPTITTAPAYRPLLPLPLSDDTDAPDTNNSVTRRGYGAMVLRSGA